MRTIYHPSNPNEEEQPMNLLMSLRRFRQAGFGRRHRCLQLRLEHLESRLVPSDGTGAGTVLVKDFFNPAAGVSPTIYEMGDLNGTLLASVQDGGSGFQGVELWKRDGTAAGT